jgi:Protein of unknown function (DUF2852)
MPLSHIPMVARLDELGKPAWIALTILGFMIWWPLGLALLVFTLGSGRMSRWQNVGPWQGQHYMGNPGTWWQPSRSSGNRAFDEYRQETLRRLEDEQREFKEFLARLRMAKDRAEFDQFMAERRSRSGGSSSQDISPASSGQG